MIKSFTVTNYRGESLDVELRSPEKSGLAVRNITGVTPTRANVNISESLYQDGGYFNSARGTSRNIVFDLAFFETETESIEDVRQKTYRFFPTKKPLTLYFETDNRKVYVDGYVESNEPNIFSKEESTQISIVCPDPAFYTGVAVPLLFSGVQPAFSFPFSNESLVSPLIKFGEIITATEKSIYYEGDEDVGVVIEIYFVGNVTNPKVYNNTTGQAMLLTGSVIQTITGSQPVAGDKIVISTVKNNKYIKLYRGATIYNILAALGSTSSWIKLQQGDNLFVYAATSGVASMQLTIIYKTLYGGI
jgi:hypothetical protein